MSSSGPTRKSTVRFTPRRLSIWSAPFVSISGLGQQHVLAALLVVVRGLQERRRLAGVHRPVAEVELGHGSSVVAAGRLRAAAPRTSAALPRSIAPALDELGAAARRGRRGSQRVATPPWPAGARARTRADRGDRDAGVRGIRPQTREPSNEYPRASPRAQRARKCPIASSGSSTARKRSSCGCRCTAGPPASTFCARSPHASTRRARRDRGSTDAATTASWRATR